MNKIAVIFLTLATTWVFGMSLGTLNAASKEELMQIKGVGEAKAAAIIKERKKGKFKSFDDLERVKGVGPQLASNIKNGIKAGQKSQKVSKSVTKKRSTQTKSTTSKRDIKSVDKKKSELKTKSKKSKETKSKN
jgi:competence protein ComEA